MEVKIKPNKKAIQDEIAIQALDVEKNFEDVKAVDGIWFIIRKGECFGFLGPNGAGKTTMINILSCYLKPSSGNAFVAGLEVVEERPQVKKHIGMAPQDNIFYENLTVYDNIIFFGSMYTIDSNILKERANILIKKMGLEEKKKTKAKKLSGGMKRRLNLIIGLIHDPDILFLDEPTTGLDPQSRRFIWDYISELKNRNKTIFLTTHYMDEADILSDHLAIIDHGKIIAEGTPESLKETIGKGDLLNLKVEGNTEMILPCIEEIKTMEDIIDAHYIKDDTIVRITAMDGVGKIGKIIMHFNTYNLQVVDVQVQRNSLENVFLSLTGRSLREK